MSLIEKRSVSLVDKYTLKKGYAFMTGIQALVRLPLVQRVLDLKAGLPHSWLYQRLSWFTLRRF